MSPTARDTAWVGREFDRRADTYDHSAMHHWLAEQAAALLHPSHGDRILDVATGTGLGARACTQITGAPHRIVGVDVALRMLEAAARMSGSSYLRADAAQLPFQPGVFDAVLCVAAVSYFPDFPDFPAAVLECRRVARPAGTLLFTTSAADGSTALRLLRQAAAEHHLNLPDPHAILGTAQRIGETARHLGLHVDHKERRSYPDQLDPDPKTAYDTVLNYGFADLLRTAPTTVRNRVYASYAAAHHTTRTNQTGEHTFMITRCRFPN